MKFENEIVRSAINSSLDLLVIINKRKFLHLIRSALPTDGGFLLGTFTLRSSDEV